MNGNKRIAFLCHPYHRGGVTRWMADASLALAKKDIEVYFITVEPVREFVSAKGRETMLQLLNKEDNAIHILTAKVGSEFEFGTPEYRTYIYRKLLLQLPLGTPVILSDDGPVWDAATYLHRSYPVIGVLHADEAHYYNLAKKYAGQVQALVCVSQRISRTVRHEIPSIDSACIFTIPCGIDLLPVHNSIDTGDLLQLVYVGRISDYQKRTGDLVKIGALLAKNNVRFHLKIIGEGQLTPALEDQVKEAGLQEQVTILGWRSQKEVAGYLSASDVLVLTSNFEGTPIAMMEALASGCGFVGTRVSGVEDYEHHPLAADCLSVYTVGDMEDAVNKIKKVAAIPRDTRRQAARALAEAEFSMATCLERYLQAIVTIKQGAMPAQEIRFPFYKVLYSKAIAATRYLKIISIRR